MIEVPLHVFLPLPALQLTVDDCRFFTQLALPTEIVVQEAQICTPRMARAYHLNLWLVDGKLVDYTTLRARRGSDFRGTGSEDAAILCEVFENHGSDGHVDYRLVGYRVVRESELPQPNAARAPRFMLDPSWESEPC